LASFAQGRRQVSFPGAGSADQDQIVRRFHKPGARQLLDLRLRQWRFRPIDAGEIPMHREPRRLELIPQAANLPIGQFGLDQPIQPGLGLHRPPRPLGQQLAPGRRHAVQM
jgi:hypothetical protein